MSFQKFYQNINDVENLLKSGGAKILQSDEIKNLFKGKKIDLRKINHIIKNNNKLYNFSKINENLIDKKNRKKKKEKFRILDLFCGAGGFSKGFESSGFSISNSVDFNKVFIKTHKINFPNSKSLVFDLNKLEPKNLQKKEKYFDVIIGSPPCQTFSSVGQGKIKSLNKNIKNDFLNYLYLSFIRFIKFFKPKIFLLENVPGFKTKYNGEMFNDFIDKLKNEYNISYEVIDAKNFNVPQSRKRLFIFGQLKSFKKKLNIFSDIKKIKNKKITAYEAISDLPSITDDWRLDSLFYSKNKNLNQYQIKMRNINSKIVTNNICRISNIEAKKLFSYLSPGEKYSNLNNNIKKKINLFKNFKSQIIHQRVKRLPVDDISWTIIAHIGMDGYEYVHPIENRTLSVREAARIQGFKDDFIFTGNMREQYIQVGNSVSPIVSEYFAQRIYNFLDLY